MNDWDQCADCGHRRDIHAVACMKKEYAYAIGGQRVARFCKCLAFVDAERSE